MRLLRFLLFPFSILYGLVVSIRNLFYDWGVYKSQSFDIPVICIGNLAVGGTGKSPMIEYLVRMLQDRYKVAVLSRGYGRKTKGFYLVQDNDTADLCGDEPLQFKKKFTGITVAVCEKRVEGIKTLKDSHDVILLDDGFQHRAVKPGVSLLLFDYNRLKESKLTFPAGNNREPFWGRKRASAMVVTKTLSVLTDTQRGKILNVLDPEDEQEVFFSYLKYGDLKPVFVLDQPDLPVDSLKSKKRVLLLTGIANPSPLVNMLTKVNSSISHHEYPDHHPFSKKNISKLVNDYYSEDSIEQIIITTEKDAQRLLVPDIKELLDKLPIYVIPVEAAFHQPGRFVFHKMIEDYVSEHL